MKCSRPSCAKSARAKGLCHVHHAAAAKNGVLLTGLTAPDAARAHLEWLISEGVSLSEIGRAAGVSWHTLDRLRKGGFPVWKSTEAKLLKARPGLEQRVAAEAKVPVLGVRRRLQALVVIGWDTRRLAETLGVPPVTVWRYLNQSDRVEVYMARKVCGLFDELHLTPGPSVRARNCGRKKGWVSSLAWDDIDDPNEKPNVGKHELVSASERIAELRALGVTDVHRIAARLGIKAESVERQLFRGAA